jgi:hypothetical protein
LLAAVDEDEVVDVLVLVLGAELLEPVEREEPLKLPEFEEPLKLPEFDDEEPLPADFSSLRFSPLRCSSSRCELLVRQLREPRSPNLPRS